MGRVSKHTGGPHHLRILGLVLCSPLPICQTQALECCGGAATLRVNSLVCSRHTFTGAAAVCRATGAESLDSRVWISIGW